MVSAIAGGLLAALSLTQQTDTTIPVDPSARLTARNYGGGMVVRTWERNAIRVRASHSRGDQIVVDVGPGDVRVRPASWRVGADGFDVTIAAPDRVSVPVRGPRRPTIMEYELTVPAGMALDLGGPYTDVIVEGARGEVNVKVNEGNVTVRGGGGRVSVQAVEGQVTVSGVQGDVRLVSIDGPVHLEDATGDVMVETTDGAITLADIRSESVEAFTVDGDIRFSGVIRERGRYLFSTHGGDIAVHIPRTTNARVTFATFDGHFVSDFPVTMPPGARGRRLTFTLGTGAADIDLEAFDGEIQLRYLEAPRQR
jgi:hypothetical protein